MAEKKTTWKKWAGAVAAAVLIGVGGGEYIQNNHASDPVGTTVEMVQGQVLELPAVNEGDRIVTYTGYTSSYNTGTLIPDWVAYELTAEETRGEVDRDEMKFSMDLNFKGRQARREDYANSGWTKGHMAPAKDFMWDEDAMEETFYFLNICPQRKELNAGDWNYLEKQVRRWAREFGKVWVVSGPIVGDNIHGTIGEDKVVVPDAFFKAVLAPSGKGYQAIAFVMDNDTNRYYLEKAAMSVDDLERLTGIDFYPALPDEVENAVEDGFNLAFWGIDYKK